MAENDVKGDGDKAPEGGGAGASGDTETKKVEGGADENKGGDRKAALDASGDAGGEGKDKQDSKSPEGDKSPSEFKLVVPEGVDVDGDYFKNFSEVLKTVPGMTSEIGNKLLELDMKRQSDFIDAQIKDWEGKDDKWQEELKADKEIGGDKFPESKLAYTRAVKNVLGADFAAVLKENGLQNHPVLMRAIVRLGHGIKEDNSGGSRGTNSGGTPTGDERWANFYNTKQPRR